MQIFLLTVIIYFIAYYISIKILEKKQRLHVLKGLSQVPILSSLIFSFVPVIRLIFVTMLYYICFCSQETFEYINNEIKH